LIAEAVRRLKNGDVVAFPTETVYGLGADATNNHAIQKIYVAKGRPSHHPLIVHLAAPLALLANAKTTTDALADAWLQIISPWARDIPPAAMQLILAFWPGPLTLVLKKDKHVLDTITGGQSTVALRSPSHPLAQELLAAFGEALVAPSANRFGKVSPTRAADVYAEFGNESEILILDGGDCEFGIESTIVDLTTSDEIRLLRPGMITPSSIYAKTGLHIDTLTSAEQEAVSPRVSGSFKAHYAPNTPLQLYQADKLNTSLNELDAQIALQNHFRKLRIGLGIWESTAGLPTVPPNIPLSSIQAEIFTLPNDHLSFANSLYRTLRDLDLQNYDIILLPAPPTGEVWDGARDRLQRAAFGSGPSSANQASN
jgi:L-threonylcarbamoyladenylate synthase